MTFPESPHLHVGLGDQVGIITLWTKKEHVMEHVPEKLYAVISQLYSRDEGLSEIIRGLLENPGIRDVVIVGADLNTCADTLIALWQNGVKNGEVQGMPGYVDTEIPTETIDSVRKNVTVHDLRKEKDYSIVAEYIQKIPKKKAWGESQTFKRQRIIPPMTFPTAHQHALRADSIDRAAIDLAHQLSRFGKLANVHVHLTETGKLTGRYIEHDVEYTKNLLQNIPGTYGGQLHKDNRLGKLVSTLTNSDSCTITLSDEAEEPLLELIQIIRLQDGLHLSGFVRETSLQEFPLLASALFSLLQVIAGELDEPAGTITLSVASFTPSNADHYFAGKPVILRRTGDPRSNILVKVKEGRIWVTHLSPDGKRLEEFSGENAMELYKRLVVEHRITDLSHAAYLGYELGKAEIALGNGTMYEQDGR